MNTCAPTMLTSAVLAHPQRELIAAHSVNHQSDGVILEPHYDLSDEPPDGALARHRRRAGTVSDALDIRASASRRSRSSWVSGFCACRQPRQLVLERPHREQARVPALLQFGRYQTGPCSRPSSHLPYFFVYF
jgi:hypothetical protein